MTKIYCLIFISLELILGFIGIIATKISLKRDQEQFEKWFEKERKDENDDQ